MVADINPGIGSSSPTLLTPLNGNVFFVASDGSTGRELWKSDGTVAGTTRVKDIEPGSGSSWPDNLTNVAGTLFFTATTSAAGQEVWMSDGTDTGTVLVRDINPGSAGSSPSWLVNANGTLFFAANDGTHGSELWMVRDPVRGQGPSTFSPPGLGHGNGKGLLAGSHSTRGNHPWLAIAAMMGSGVSDGPSAHPALMAGILPLGAAAPEGGANSPPMASAGAPRSAIPGAGPTLADIPSGFLGGASRTASIDAFFAALLPDWSAPFGW
jgi:ELWxxDGT repeat protein